MTSELGEFLRARRARISPQQVGLAPGLGRRRVPGLRREETALLAGVSVNYYVHLEQGRTAHVSDSVLDAVARVLCLTDTEREHLANLVRPGRSGQQPTARLSPSVRQLLDLMHEVPAVVLGRRMELLACNDAAQAVFGAQLARPGTSAARAFFLDPRARSQHLSWDSVAADLVAQLRLEAGRHPDDAKLASLVGELSMGSEPFARLWARGDVRTKTDGLTRLAHPLVGELELTYQILQLPDRPEQSIATYSYGLGTPTQERMRLLLSWHAPASEARRTSDTSGTTTPP